MKATSKWVGDRLIETCEIPCPTGGCRQIFEVDSVRYVRADLNSNRLDLVEYATEGAEFADGPIVMNYVRYGCPRCGERLDELWSTAAPVVGVRPLTGPWRSLLLSVFRVGSFFYRLVEAVQWVLAWVLRRLRPMPLDVSR